MIINTVYAGWRDLLYLNFVKYLFYVCDYRMQWIYKICTERFWTQFGGCARRVHFCIPRPAAKHSNFAVRKLREFSPWAFRQRKRGAHSAPLLRWRRRRDSNSRTAFDGYTISSRAPSTGLGDFSILSLPHSVMCGDSYIISQFIEKIKPFFEIFSDFI